MIRQMEMEMVQKETQQNNLRQGPYPVAVKGCYQNWTKFEKASMKNHRKASKISNIIENLDLRYPFSLYFFTNSNRKRRNKDNCLIEMYGFNQRHDQDKSSFINNLIHFFDPYLTAMFEFEYGCQILNKESWYIQIERRIKKLDEKLIEIGMEKIDTEHFCSDFADSDVYYACLLNQNQANRFFSLLFKGQVMQLEDFSYKDFN